MAGGDDEQKAIATNRRARHDYEILERVEAGLVLLGPEVKSLRAGKASLSDAYALIRKLTCVTTNALMSKRQRSGGKQRSYWARGPAN